MTSIPSVTNSSTSKNKKLQSEFSNFDKKVAFLALTSLYNGKHFPKSEINCVFQKLPDNSSSKIKLKIEAEKSRNLPNQVVTLEVWERFFSQFFTCFHSICHGHEFKKAKFNLFIRIREMFASPDFDSSILVYTGPFTSKGTIPIETDEKGLEEISFDDVYTQWKERKSSQKHLLIVLDCNFAGKWIKALSDQKDKCETVSIFASCAANQKNPCFELGTHFSFNMMKVFNKTQIENLLPANTDPCFFNNFLLCKKFTNLYLKFDGWQSITNFQKSDYVTIEYDNGKYWGHISGGQKHFWGCFSWKTGSFKGSHYVGEFEKGKLHGKGIMVYNNGRVYEGDFIWNSPDGFGVESYENGDSYEGRFSKGFKSGKGVYVYRNGDKYEGIFIENKPHGYGVLTMAKSAVYKGWFQKGKCNGKGEYTYENGDVYNGDWVDSVKHGQGVYKNSKGGVYTGGFVNGLRHGKGKMEFKNGEVYEGGWDKDIMSGEGKFRTTDGVQKGEWVNGKIDKDTKFFDKSGNIKISVDI